MLKALLKKQFTQIYAQLFRSGKRNAKKSAGRTVLYLILFLYVIGCFEFIFFGMADSLCLPLITMNLGWMYFCFMGLLGVSLSVIGSVFLTQSQLYTAKDNELLLSMPIPPMMILFVRILSLFVINLCFILFIMIPTFVTYYRVTGMMGMGNMPSVSGIQMVFWILIVFMLALVAQSLSCILGWIVALISSKSKNKNIITIVMSLVLFGAYLYGCSRLNSIISDILADSQNISEGMKTSIYPLYQMGLACCGEVIPMLIFSAISVGAFALIYWVLTKTFINIATSNRGAAKRVYHKKAMKQATVDQALLRKEWIRFISTPTYLLNCGLGVVFLIIGAVAIIVKKDTILLVLYTVFEGDDSMFPLLGIIAISFICAVNVLTAPSISLEGVTLWNLQSLPVQMDQVITAKLKLQLWVNGVPAALCSLAIDYVIKPGVLSGILVLLVPQCVNLLSALIGLCLNLKHPNLNWTNETYAVKQNMSVVVTLFINWGILLGFALIYIAISSSESLNEVITPVVYALACLVINIIMCILLWKWIQKKGLQILAYCSAE